MFVAPHEYKERLCRMIEEEESLDVAVAFWGRGAEDLFDLKAGKRLNLLCNLRSGSTNPAIIRALLSAAEQSNGRIKIRQCDKLHAKAIVGRQQVLIGSANLSTNGLGLENDESAHWLEAAIHSRQDADIKPAQKWFKALWRSPECRPITANDIEEAQAVWDENRRNRTNTIGKNNDPFNIHDYTVADLAGRPAYALLYNSRPSPEAKAKAKDQTKAIAKQQGQPVANLNFTTYESWPTKLDSTGATDYLGIFLDGKGGITIEEVSRVKLERSFFAYKDPAEGEGWIDLATPTTQLLKRRFFEKERRALQKTLKKRISEIWDAAEGDDPWARTIHLADLARVLKCEAGSAE